MKCQFFFFFSLFFLLQPVKGEMDSNRQLFQVYADSIKITVSCLNDQIIHVQATPEGSVGKESLVALKNHALKPTFCSVQKNEEGISMLTSKLTISYSTTDKCISFTDRISGELLLKEKMRDFVRQHIGEEDVWNIRQVFSLTPEEAIYGLGQYQEGVMNYRGKKVKLLQANKDIVNPFLISTRSYGILWDNYSKTLFEDNEHGATFWSEVADEIKEIFRQQYGITTDSTRETVTETKTVRVGESLGLVVTSGYCNCPICCGQWSGGPTASGAMPTANHTIAVDAANPFVPIGTHVVMNGVEYVVEDTGAFARYGVQFDVYYDNHAAASAHGHQTWEAYIADSNGNQEVQVTTTKEVNRLDVTMTNHSLDAVLRSRMTEEEQERYDAYNKYYGNRDYLFDLNSIPTGSSGFGYDIPADALSDPQFAKMIQEAEKYLGVPYVWGGYSPSGFDCSGFVSWVINNCGNGWNVGRCTADELRSHCSQVSPSEAKPGDLIFFQGTYDTPGASHVGIYVGNNMMIHCGKPVQYTSIASAYWQEHFMAFGRLH